MNDEEAGGPGLLESFERVLMATRQARRHERFFEARSLRADHLTRGEVFLLASIAEQGPVRLSDLATATNLDRSIASRQADALVRARLVDRLPDPSDGRAALLRPSRRGRSVLTKLRAERERWLANAVRSLEPEEISALARLLPRLAEAIETAEDE